MAVVDVAIAVGAAVGLEGTAAVIGGGAILGAGVGAGYSLLTGDGNVLNSALTGAALGGAAMGIAGAATAAPALTATEAAASASPALQAAGTLTSADVAGLNQAALSQGVFAEGSAALPGANLAVAPEVVPSVANTAINPATGLPIGGTGSAGINAALQEGLTESGKKVATGLAAKDLLTYGLAGTAAMSLLGGQKQKGISGANTGTSGPQMIRPYTYAQTKNPNYGQPGEPYFIQSYTAQTPYKAAAGGLMAIGGGVGNMYPQSQQEHTNFANPTQMPTSAEVVNADFDPITNPYTGEQPRYAEGGVARFSIGGEDDEDEKTRKAIIKNLMHSQSDKNMSEMGADQMFLMKHMPNYAAAMSPSVLGMIEGSQYGDRMGRSYMEAKRNNALKNGENFEEQSSDYVRVNPRVNDLQNYGGIASIAKQLDPETRLNLMADVQRSPYDRNTLEAIRRIGGGVSRKLDKDSDISAFYEQDPMGRNKSGGLRYSQRFAEGGMPDPVQPATLVEPTTTYTQAPQAPTQLQQQIANYNRGIAAAANQEYNIMPAPLPTLPGGGQGASREDLNKIINQYYVKNLGRQGEQSGLDAFSQQVQQGTSLADINKNIANSPEGVTYSAYTDLLGRRPDEGGMQFWQKYIQEGHTPQEIRDAFMKSPEYLAKHPVPITPTIDNPVATVGPGVTTGVTQADIDAYMVAHPTNARTYNPITQTYNTATPSAADVAAWKATQVPTDNSSTTMYRAPNGQLWASKEDYDNAHREAAGGVIHAASGGIMGAYAVGGQTYDLGGYSDGGRLLKGPGDGMSDNIPASIANKQPARLADGEFVVPADVVSHLGNGSTDAGAKRLYAMMDNVRKARTGNKKQGKQIKANKYLPT